jgi:hypothetical protein
LPVVPRSVVRFFFARFLFAAIRFHLFRSTLSFDAYIGFDLQPAIGASGAVDRGRVLRDDAIKLVPVRERP